MRNFCKCFTFCIIIKPYFMYRLPAQRKFLRQSMFRTARFDNNFCFHMPNQPCTFYNPEKLKRIQFYQHRPWSIVFCFCFTLFFINAVFFFFDLISFLLYWFQNVYSFFDSFEHRSDLNLLQMIISLRFYFSTSSTPSN